jgi:uncharacterized SAM-binding protein YcdF (DUF218 family)
LVFYSKKILGMALDPLTLSIVFICAGLVLLMASKQKQHLGKWLAGAGLIILVLASFGPTSGYLLLRLENVYPVFKPDKENTRGVKWIVILGGGKNACPDVAVSGRLNQEALQRLVEGIYLLREVPNARIILSGGIPENGISNSRAYAITAVRLGIDKSRIVLEERPKDTHEEAVTIKETVKRDRFILVTSAYHMKRAIALFKKQGMYPIPAPAGHLIRGCLLFKPENIMFTSGNIQNSSRAVHELLGILYSKITGQI